MQAVEFTPQFQKHAGELCHGIYIQIDDREPFKPYRFGMALLIAAAHTFPEHFSWRKEPYEFVEDVPAIDLLFGSSTLREVVEGYTPVDQLRGQLESFERRYQSARTQCFLY